MTLTRKTASPQALPPDTSVAELTRHRILFYSHDSFGLGHFRRSLTIASYLTRHIDKLSTLMLTGLDLPGAFESPVGVDFVKLPSIWKAGPDDYRSRHLRVSFTRVRRIRKNLIRTVASAFDPDILVVDNVARGAEGELLPTLRYLRAHRPNTRIVLTLRDVLDAPERIIPEWKKHDVYQTLEEFYDEIWVAGCKAVFDPVQLYAIPRKLVPRVKFCGYVVRSAPRQAGEMLRRQLRLGEGPLVVVSCGGGGDGYDLLNAYIDAAVPLAGEGVQSAVFLGPDMAPGQRRELKQRLLSLGDGFLAFDFHPDLVSFLQMASASVSMAGYNTTCEILSVGVPALVIPRTTPRVEQLLRADAFAAHGLLRVLRPEDLNAESLRAALRSLLAQARRRKVKALPAGVDFVGLKRITRRVRKHLGLGVAA